MGRQLQRLDSGFGGNQHSGCMWGILHILDYHRWHNVKKMLPYKRHGGRRRVHGKLSFHLSFPLLHLFHDLMEHFFFFFLIPVRKVYKELND